ncbi:MAG: NAD-dependent epimerase/dehydratase family protein [Planctomycetota bacterium]|nr:NAD-dependent epimerase/dehydratase family protein [Planctomycetota bacterium]
MHVLVTGSSGLIGSEAVQFFDAKGFNVLGIDNNMRADFFGPKGDTEWNRHRLERECKHFQHRSLDIRDRGAVDSLFAHHPVDLVIHAAAQPSHDLAAKRPFDDFDVNAVGTFNLLEALRRHREHAAFIHVSTNKVYGDGPNRLALREGAFRFDFADEAYVHGISETFPVDQCLHSLFGASKLAGDIVAQEYGRYFGLKVGVFRGGCLTGPQHSGVELHGFLNYLVKVAMNEGPYTIFGYKGKQVRDQIHCHDVIEAFWQFAQNPRPGEVYNIGGGHANSASLLECIERVAQRTGKRPKTTYTEENRVGDHICYYTDLRKLQAHYPSWRITRTLDDIIDEMVENFRALRKAA